MALVDARPGALVEPTWPDGASGARRVLAAVLFTDIVGSTERAASLGDARWRGLLEEHFAASDREIVAHGGVRVKRTGDGVVATFDAPTRAIGCGRAILEANRPLGLSVRAGLHAGEIEHIDRDIGGIGVHVAARVCRRAAPGEMLASRTVVELVLGSGIPFVERGTHELRGVPGLWSLWAVGPG
jgi:class 3 adenylate cyclase